MKLLVITAFYPPHQTGGYELRCRDVVEGLKTRGHEILILTDRCKDPHCQLHIDEHEVRRTLRQRSEASNVIQQIFHDRSDMQFIDRAVKAFRPDAIYLWHIQNLSNAILPYFSVRNIPIVYDEGGSGLIYLARVHKRGIYFYRNEEDPLLKKWSKQVVYRFASLVSLGLIQPDWQWPSSMKIYFNGWSSLEHSRSMGVPVDGAAVIHSGLNIAGFPYSPRRRMNSPLTVLVPSRIKQEKGIKDAVALVGELVKRGISSRLKLIGKVQSQEYFKSVLDAVHKNGLDDAFEYLPMVSHAELARFYQQADVCFFPTYFHTGFSRVPLEAMASGCLILTYGNEGSNEVVQDGETGFVIPEGDIASAADRIGDLLDEPELYVMMVQAARKRVENEHTMEIYVNAVDAFLREVL